MPIEVTCVFCYPFARRHAWQRVQMLIPALLPFVCAKLYGQDPQAVIVVPTSDFRLSLYLNFWLIGCHFMLPIKWMMLTVVVVVVVVVVVAVVMVVVAAVAVAVVAAVTVAASAAAVAVGSD